MKSACPRLPEVEAVRDGRLSSGALGDHLESCPVCSAEAVALEQVSRLLQDLPTETPDELSVRRRRRQLLQATSQQRPARRVPFSVFAAGLGAATVATVLLWNTPTPEPIVVAGTSARWSQLDAGTTTRITLEDGELDIRVDHRQDRSLVVTLPDGELRDVGTIFHVRVLGGRTASVSVLEGAVELWLVGREPVTVRAGESWAAPASSPSESPSVSAPAPPPPPAPRLPPLARLPATSVARPDVGAAFRGAFEAFESGQSAQAASGFRSFLALHAGDPRAEDAAYLLVLSLRRAGADGAAREAAADYLRRFPAGFRRAEIEKLR